MASRRDRRPPAKTKGAATNGGKLGIGWNLDSDHDFEPDEETPQTDVTAQEPLRDLILQAFADYDVLQEGDRS